MNAISAKEATGVKLFTVSNGRFLNRKRLPAMFDEAMNRML